MEKFEWPWEKKARLKLEEAERIAEVERKKALQEIQDRIGNELFMELEIATKNNKLSNTMPDGKKSSSTEPIELVRIPDHRNGYSIFAVMKDDTAYCIMPGGHRGHTIYGISINLSRNGKEIHFFRCPYGPEDSYRDISHLEEFKRLMTAKLENYRMFRA